jgi:hypothetical protein
VLRVHGGNERWEYTLGERKWSANEAPSRENGCIRTAVDCKGAPRISVMMREEINQLGARYAASPEFKMPGAYVRRFAGISSMCNQMATQSCAHQCLAVRWTNAEAAELSDHRQIVGLCGRRW